MTEYLNGAISTFQIDENLTGFGALSSLVIGMKDDYMKNLSMKNLVANFDFFYENEYPDLPIVNKFEQAAQEINNKFEDIIQKGIDDKSIKEDINPRLYGCLIGNMGASFGNRTALRRAILTRNQKIDPFEEFCLALDLILNALVNN